MQRTNIKVKKFRIISILSGVFLYGMVFSNSCFAYSIVPEPGGDAMSISPVASIPSTPPTASLSLSTSSPASLAVTPGSTATASLNVTVNVSNASSYSLTLSFDKTNITSGSTTITAGNAVTNNTWGYKWDNAASYAAPSTTGAALVVPALSSNSVSFTKTLAFAAKFASNADAGHYKANGTLSLTASPQVVTLANLTQMQQLAPGYAPDACRNTTIPSGQDYAGPYTLTDVRDKRKYTVYKFKDNKCWMTQNLKLSEKDDGGSQIYSGRTLNSTTSDITASTWTLPGSNLASFGSDPAAISTYNVVMVDNTTNAGFYSWCAATAGTCTSATSSGQNAPSSICPKGWKIPTGGSSGEFQALYNAAGITNNAAGSTKAQGSPYNFAYTGYVNSGKYYDPASNSIGIWWSRTGYNGTQAYNFYIDDRDVEFANYGGRYDGLAVRCVAQ